MTNEQALRAVAHIREVLTQAKGNNHFLNIYALSPSDLNSLLEAVGDLEDGLREGLNEASWFPGTVGTHFAGLPVKPTSEKK